MRKVSGLLLMILMALMLAACGGDDKKAEPTVAPIVESVSTEVPTEPAAAMEATVAEEATAIVAEASPAVGAVEGVASPEMVASPAVVASPVTSASPVAVASPVANGSPEAMDSPALVAPVQDMTPEVLASPVSSTPAASSVVIPETPSEATPDASPAAMVTLNGRVELNGNVNQAYVLSDTGCVGLGANADMEAGRQVVIRNEMGEIIGVAELEASDDYSTCAWTFTVDVEESEFYAVTIPLKTELVFTHDDIAKSDGEITIILP